MPVPAASVQRFAIHVTGVVQGVGFRPFVWHLAQLDQLLGWVRNDAGGVHIEVQGSTPGLRRFVEGLTVEAPPLARVDTVTVEAQEPLLSPPSGFVVLASLAGEGQAEIPADVATCEACQGELLNPVDRRFRHPFVNCTDCGPRYSIVRDLPYDRATTTMASFPLCPDCEAEYVDPANRRFHAEPVCCPRCGPQLRLLDKHGVDQASSNPIGDVADLLMSGAIVAIKGIGGFHLATLACDEAAVSRLRARKHREDKPFAVLVADIDAALQLCRVDDDEAAALRGPEAPIVLVTRITEARITEADIAPSVAPGRDELGVLLPPTGLHHLLIRAVGNPIVLTSGNRSDEPMATDDSEAVSRLRGIADAYLSHDRPIWRRVDDSVVRRFTTGMTVLRRARGYAPSPIRLPVATPVPLLAVGAELKSTVCLMVEDRAYLSPHLGDLEHLDAFESFREAIDDLSRLIGVRPQIVITDLHPEYLSTKHAATLDLPVRTVQHHHAHLAACLAEHGRSEPVLAAVFDGIGLGSDGTLWGGELLVGGLTGTSRVGHLAPVAMPGGTAAIRNPWRMAVAYLAGRESDDLAVHRAHAAHWATVAALSERGDLSPMTTSAGRLFDAVAALCGLDGRDGRVTHEGQAAQQLEQAARRSGDNGFYQFGMTNTDPIVIDHNPVIDAILGDLRAGEPVEHIARRFHRALARVVSFAAERLCVAHGLDTVVLSGGVFQNALLVGDCHHALSRQGLHVIAHHRVPPNDGGISLGQAATIAAQLAGVVRPG